jgi:hypothetical protein
MKTDEGKSIFKKYLADMPDTNNSINKTMDNVIDDLDINLRANAGKIDTPDKSINKIQSFTEKFKNTTIKVTILGVTGLLGLALGEYLYDKFIEKDAFRGNVTRIVKEEGKTNSLIIYYTPDVNWCNGSKVIVKEFRGVTPSIDGQVFNPDVIGPGILRLSPTILPIQNVNKDADGIIAYGYETYSEIDCLIERPSSPGDGDGGDGGGEADGDGDGDGEDTIIIKPTSTKKLSTYIYIGIFIIVIIVIIFFLKKNIFKYK